MLPSPLARKGPAVFTNASLQLQSTSRDGKSIVADLVGTADIGLPTLQKVRVKNYLSGTPVAVLQQWLERQGGGGPKVADLGAHIVMLVLETPENVIDVRQEAGFVVITSRVPGERAEFVTLFDDKYMAVTDNVSRLMMAHPQQGKTRHFTFDSTMLKQVQKIPGVRSAKPEIFAVLEAAAI
jgi:hypothetical protein